MSQIESSGEGEGQAAETAQKPTYDEYVGAYNNRITSTTSTAMQKLTITALLIAIGIVIPLVMPKVVIEPASFTLASHVAIFLAVLISPRVAAAVVAGTTAGFFFAAFPHVVVFRAASHIVFALIASNFIKRRPEVLYSPVKFHIFSIVVGLIHAVCEVAASLIYYVTLGGMTSVSGEWAFQFLFLLVGVGTVVHSLVDFEIAYGVFRALVRVPGLSNVFEYTNPRAAKRAA